MIISFASAKGGVAKTTTCVNLAYALANTSKNYKVLVVDFDTQGGLSHHLSSVFNKKFTASISDVISGNCKFETAIHRYSKNLHIIPANIRLSDFSTKDFSDEIKKYLITPARKQYDFIFFDLSPGVYPLSTIPLYYSDVCIIPVLVSGGLSILGLQSQEEVLVEVEEITGKKIPIIGILATHHENTKVSKQTIDFLETDYKKLMFKSIIRKNTKISQSACLGKTIFEHSPKSNASKDYQNFMKEFLKRVSLFKKNKGKK